MQSKRDESVVLSFPRAQCDIAPGSTVGCRKVRAVHEACSGRARRCVMAPCPAPVTEGTDGLWSLLPYEYPDESWLAQKVSDNPPGRRPIYIPRCRHSSRALLARKQFVWPIKGRVIDPCRCGSILARRTRKRHRLFPRQWLIARLLGQVDFHDHVNIPWRPERSRQSATAECVDPLYRGW